MIPRDWFLVVQGINDQADPGRNDPPAPTQSEINDLISQYQEHKEAAV